MDKSKANNTAHSWLQLYAMSLVAGVKIYLYNSLTIK
jgi:hypothetical protein